MEYIFLWYIPLAGPVDEIRISQVDLQALDLPKPGVPSPSSSTKSIGRARSWKAAFRHQFLTPSPHFGLMSKVRWIHKDLQGDNSPQVN